eukprot:11210122-Lingulodinium_polyedra.AAC.1
MPPRLLSRASNKARLRRAIIVVVLPPQGLRAGATRNSVAVPLARGSARPQLRREFLQCHVGNCWGVPHLFGGQAGGRG